MYLIDSSAVGWPLRAFRWEETFGVVGNAVLTDDESSEFGFRGMLGLTQQVGVPALPIWPGLLLNTLFYGAIWFALFTALAALRTARRLRRGLCPLCRYDLRGLPQRACPECGWGRTPPAPQAAVPTLQPEGLRRQ
ncbi:MAG: hypothetical protein KJZ54_14440 [Phycisphaerales bacterium]|nr:hypothetical protein [Phycisphaerales bacterium]